MPAESSYARLIEYPLFVRRMVEFIGPSKYCGSRWTFRIRKFSAVK
jgi:hypothetical protein